MILDLSLYGIARYLIVGLVAFVAIVALFPISSPPEKRRPK